MKCSTIIIIFVHSVAYSGTLL